MSEFPIVEIGSVARIQSGFSFKSSDWKADGIPVVKIANVKNGRVDHEGLGYVDEQVAEKASRFSLSTGDVLLAMTGYVGEVAVVRDWDLPLLLNQRVGRCEPMSMDVDKSFLYYALSSADARRQLENLAQGSAQPNLSARDFGSVEVRLPPLSEQQAIAGVLGALDDKIESNRRLAELVDGLIRAEFQRFAEQETSEIVVVGEIINRVHNAVNPSTLPPTTEYIGLEHMPRGLMFLDQWGNAGGVDSGKSHFEVSDVLFGKLRPNFRKVGIAPLSGICSTDILVLRPKSGFSVALVLAIVTSEVVLGPAIAASSGTKMPRVSWEYLSGLPIRVPDVSGRTEFTDTVDPMIQRAMKSLLENRTLENVRDSLLPELLSGRLRVRDAEKVVEGAV